MPRRQLAEAFRRRFGRPEISDDNMKSLCHRKGWMTGRTGCFSPGAVPANKGKKMPFNPNSAKTQFKKGHLPHNTHYLGHERVTRDGYVEISVDQTNPYTGYERSYVLKHRWLWEQENGPVPDGHALKCLDGNRQNTAPANWKAIPRSMLPRLAGRWAIPYDSASDELKPTILAMAEVKHAAKSAKERSDA